jgi:serine/threonine protein kinase
MHNVLRKLAPYVRQSGFGRPDGRAGAHGVVFRADKWEGRSAALKLFTRDAPRRIDRYVRVAQHISSTVPKSADVVSPEADSRSCLLQTSVYSRAVRVRPSGTCEWRWFPAIVQEWVDGEMLDAFLRSNLNNQDALDDLLKSWLNVLSELRLRRVSHGDLQHGNIVVRPNGTMALVDYDGMFVPGLDVLPVGSEGGLVGYQPRSRLESGSGFGPRMDEFSALVILVTIATASPDVWGAVGAMDGLPLTQSDLDAPDSSRLIRIMSDSSTLSRRLVSLLKIAARRGTVEAPELVEACALLGFDLRPFHGSSGEERLLPPGPSKRRRRTERPIWVKGLGPRSDQAPATAAGGLAGHEVTSEEGEPREPGAALAERWFVPAGMTAADGGLDGMRWRGAGTGPMTRETDERGGATKAGFTQTGSRTRVPLEPLTRPSKVSSNRSTKDAEDLVAVIGVLVLLLAVGTTVRAIWVVASGPDPGGLLDWIEQVSYELGAICGRFVTVPGFPWMLNSASS